MRNALVSICIFSAAVCLIASMGCGGSDPYDGYNEPDYWTKGGGTGNDKDGAKKTLIESKGWATLKGRVVYDGSPPMFEQLVMNRDQETCHHAQAAMIEKSKQGWFVDPGNKGVANTVIYLKAPKDHYFKIHEKDKTRTNVVSIDQPHCNYVPHVLTLFPEYLDGYDKEGKKIIKRSGEQFVVKNSSAIGHNTKWVGDLSYGNPALNLTIGGGDQRVINSESAVKLHPKPSPTIITCDVHGWMQAFAFSFEHPYHAVTKGGNLKDEKADWGSFEIARVPAGVPVRVVLWHEGSYNVTSPAGFDSTNGKEYTFKDGETKTIEFKIKR